MWQIPYDSTDSHCSGAGATMALDARKNMEDGMPDMLNAAELRRLAVHEALLDLAQNGDWLAGRRAA